MINKLRIEGLFGIYSYMIDFSKKKNPFIITAPNGFGKTTILHIIYNVFKGNLWYFYYLPFSYIELALDNGLRFNIAKEMAYSDAKDCNAKYRTLIKMYDESQNVDEFIVDNQYIRSIIRDRISFRYRNNNIPFNDEESISSNYDLESDEYLQSKAANIYSKIRELSCLMIKEQRLIENDSYGESLFQIKTVEEIKGHLKDFLQSARNTYNRVSQQVDSTFISRLSNKESMVKLKKLNNIKLFNEVKEKVDLYKKYGLIDDLNIVGKMGVEYQEVLRLYLLDMKKKLDSIKPFYNKLELFDSLVSGKHLSYKSLSYSGDGIIIRSSKNTEIPIHKLSSGEQNLIVLCYKLVFELDGVQLLLIDEPENSLHMAWLETLLSDYKKVASMSNCQMIIATHSPAFIDGNWELTYDLCENGRIIQ